jgi:hypothetical protein
MRGSGLGSYFECRAERKIGATLAQDYISTRRVLTVNVDLLRENFIRSHPILPSTSLPPFSTRA